MKEISQECLRTILCEDKPLKERLTQIKNYLEQDHHNLNLESKQSLTTLLTQNNILLRDHTFLVNATQQGNVIISINLELKQFVGKLFSLFRKTCKKTQTTGSEVALQNIESIFHHLLDEKVALHKFLENGNVLMSILNFDRNHKEWLPIESHSKWEAIRNDLKLLGIEYHSDPFKTIIAPTMVKGKKEVKQKVINKLFDLYISLDHFSAFPQ